MQKVVVLGSTGSLGRQTLEVLEKYSEYFQIIGLSANTDAKLLKSQAKKFKVKNLALASKNGEQAVTKLTRLKEADIVINLLSGIAGIAPTKAALRSGKILILANKESLVAEGREIIRLARLNSLKSFLPFDYSDKNISNLKKCPRTQFQISQEIFLKSNGTNQLFRPRTQSPPFAASQLIDSLTPHHHLPPPNLIPLDSEHNAIYEILKKFPCLPDRQAQAKISKIILPCSGGPFLNTTNAQLQSITAKQALKHPKWSMGKKISIESATLINKGLEIIEAHYLFNLPLNKIEVKIHPECQIHGIVVFKDENNSTKNRSSNRLANKPKYKHSTVAYISSPDMRGHIKNALMEAIGIRNFPSAQIRPLKKNEFKFLPPPKHLKGLQIVLDHFKKHPHKMKQFLKKEEKIIAQFLENKITFPEIFEKLKAN